MGNKDSNNDIENKLYAEQMLNYISDLKLMLQRDTIKLNAAREALELDKQIIVLDAKDLELTLSRYQEGIKSYNKWAEANGFDQVNME
jgi:hypothetical protein